MQFRDLSEVHSPYGISPSHGIPHHHSPPSKSQLQSGIRVVKQFSPEPSRVSQLQESRSKVPTPSTPMKGQTQSRRTFLTSSKADRGQLETCMSDTHLSRRNQRTLEEQKASLLKQLEDRDQVIKSLKGHSIDHERPYNEQTINNLNLKLASKNVLIDKILTRLLEFQEKSQKEKLEMFPEWKERIFFMRDIIMENEKHPKVVLQKYIDTSHKAEKHFIEVISKKQIKEMEEVRQQAKKQQEKTIFYQQEQKKLVVFIQEQQKKHKVEIEKFQSIIRHLQNRLNDSSNESKLYDHITELKGDIYKLESQTHQLQNKINHEQQVIRQLRKQLEDQRKSRKLNEDPGWKNKSQLWYQECLRQKDQINQLNSEVSQLKIEISQKNSDMFLLKNRFDNLQMDNQELQQKYNIKQTQINNYVVEGVKSQNTIDSLNMDIMILNSKIRESEQQEKYKIIEWKMKYEEKQEELMANKAQLNQQAISIREKQQKWWELREQWQIHQKSLEAEIKELNEEIPTKRKQIEENAREVYRQILKEQLWQQMNTRSMEIVEKYKLEMSDKCTSEIQIREGSMKKLQSELAQERDEIQKLKEQLELQRQKLSSELRLQLQKECQENEELNTKVRQKQRLEFIQQLQGQLKYSLQQQIRQRLSAEIRKQIMIEVSEEIRLTLTEELTQQFTRQFNQKLSETEQKLLQVQNFLKDQEKQLLDKDEKIVNLEKSLENFNNDKFYLEKVLSEERESNNLASKLIAQERLKQQQYIKKVEQQRKVFTQNLGEKDIKIFDVYQKLEKAQTYIQELMQENQSLTEEIDHMRKNNQYDKLVLQLQKGNQRFEQERIEREKEAKKVSDKQKQCDQLIKKLQSEELIWQELRATWNKERFAWQQKKIQWEKEKIIWEQKLAKKQKEISQLDSDKSQAIQALYQQIEVFKQHLKTAQEHILISSKQSEDTILKLQKRVQQLQQKQKEGFSYIIDSRYELLGGKLLQIAQKQALSVEIETQFLELYQKRRKEEVQSLTKHIQKSLQIIRGFQSLLIVNKSKLKKLSPENMEEFLQYIENLKKLNNELTEASCENILDKLNQMHLRQEDSNS